jgi:hypothetical protein
MTDEDFNRRFDRLEAVVRETQAAIWHTLQEILEEMVAETKQPPEDKP